jgi:LuxR family maltose regulon positive regulatory protein
MAIQILQTKFFIPPSPPSRIARPQLTARLNGCLQPGRKLALVSAPAGFGKSSLLASWIETSKAGPSTEGSSKPLFGWLSLDGQDNDPARFWVYFAAALARQAPGLGAEFSRAVQAQPVWPDPETRDTLLVELLNDLAGLDRTMVLVLDDVHLITNVEIHSGLTFLILSGR